MVSTRRSPSSRGLGRGPFKAKTRVRIPMGTPDCVEDLPLEQSRQRSLTAQFPMIRLGHRRDRPPHFQQHRDDRTRVRMILDEYLPPVVSQTHQVRAYTAALASADASPCCDRRAIRLKLRLANFARSEGFQ